MRFLLIRRKLNGLIFKFELFLARIIKKLPLLSQARIKEKTHSIGEYHGLRMIADTRMEIRRLREKEPETYEWIIKNIKNGDTFYDIGACVGNYSILAANQGATVYSFEPAFANFYALCQNRFLNKPELIVPFNAALGNANRLSNITIDGDAGHTQSITAPSNNTAVVMEMRLDDLISQFNLSYPDFVKIDVDGYELKVVEGGLEILRHARSMLIEINTSDNVKAILQHLGNLGFCLSSKHPRLNGIVHNYIFEKIGDYDKL